MSTTSKKAKISEESKKFTESLLTTDDEYRNLDKYLRASKDENNVRKRKLARDIASDGEKYLQEIEEKNKDRENKRMSMIESIYSNSQEKFIPLKELKQLPYEDVVDIHNKVNEWKKPWWRKVINVFR